MGLQCKAEMRGGLSKRSRPNDADQTSWTLRAVLAAEMAIHNAPYLAPQKGVSGGLHAARIVRADLSALTGIRRYPDKNFSCWRDRGDKHDKNLQKLVMYECLPVHTPAHFCR